MNVLLFNINYISSFKPKLTLGVYYRFIRLDKETPEAVSL